MSEINDNILMPMLDLWPKKIIRARPRGNILSVCISFGIFAVNSGRKSDENKFPGTTRKIFEHPKNIVAVFCCDSNENTTAIIQTTKLNAFRAR